MKTAILTTSGSRQLALAVARATRLLREGNLVALPTETVYGLAANATDPAAVARIFASKGRPSHNPIIVHVNGAEMARKCARRWPPAARKLARAFWPGPLTLVLPRSAMIPDIVSAGGDTVGIRWPDHPVFQAVLDGCGFPLAAPSANRSNRLSPTTAGHVLASLGGRIPLILDGGPCAVGIESTVLDLTVSPAAILRPGMIGVEALSAVLGRAPAQAPGASIGPIKSPGRLARHYSPAARLLVRSFADSRELAGLIEREGLAGGDVHVVALRPVGLRGLAGSSLMPHEPGAYARALYAELHQADEAGVKVILVQAPPGTAEWLGIRDRLQRAGA